MKQFIVILFISFLGVSAHSQKVDFTKYSYVVVPDSFDFLKGSDQFQLNSMAVFYFTKSGFNAFLASKMPNANRCDGLYTNVESLGSIFTTKLQIVLRDCDGVEVYRSEIGKSKYKDFEKTYQDALRNAFKSVEALGVKQNEILLLEDSRNVSSAIIPFNETRVLTDSGAMLPTAKFSNYSKDGKSFLLRNSAEGYSLYEENPSSEDGLKLLGKIVVMDKVVKYMDISGQVSDAIFDATGNLTIKDATTSSTYQLVD